MGRQKEGERREDGGRGGGGLGGWEVRESSSASSDEGFFPRDRRDRHALHARVRACTRNNFSAVLLWFALGLPEKMFRILKKTLFFSRFNRRLRQREPNFFVLKVHKSYANLGISVTTVVVY